jgi:hypothetical protein
LFDAARIFLDRHYFREEGIRGHDPHLWPSEPQDEILHSDGAPEEVHEHQNQAVLA